jgi:hypothetical protein
VPPRDEQIDALLDEALMESFPASDSSAIGSGTTAIKQNHHELHAAAESTPLADPGSQTISGATT